MATPNTWVIDIAARIAAGLRFRRQAAEWRREFGFATRELAERSLGRALRARRDVRNDPTATDRFGRQIRPLSQDAEPIAAGVSP